jgi:hypothetical protein
MMLNCGITHKKKACCQQKNCDDQYPVIDPKNVLSSFLSRVSSFFCVFIDSTIALGRAFAAPLVFMVFSNFDSC